MKRLNIYLRNLHPLIFIPLMSVLFIGTSLLYVAVVEALGIEDVMIGKEMVLETAPKLIGVIFAAIVVAPLLETLLLQRLVYKVLSKMRYFRQNRCWIVAVSAVVFALLHHYSMHYILNALIGGALLMYFYIIKVGKRPFWNVCAIHAINNIVASIPDVKELIGMWSGESL